MRQTTDTIKGTRMHEVEAWSSKATVTAHRAELDVMDDRGRCQKLRGFGAASSAELDGKLDSDNLPDNC